MSGRASPGSDIVKFAARLLLLPILIGCGTHPAAAQAIVTLGGGFESPEGVAVDSSGNVFVGDTFHNAVKEILASGGYVTVNALGSGFSGPPGVAVDGSGNVFVADTGNNAVEEIVAAGGYVTVDAVGGDGFDSPFGVAVDASGNIFVADTFNSAVKEILAAGGYTTVNTLGSGFNYPTGVAVDANGNVFVADNSNNAVKEILASGGYTNVVTLGSGFGAPFSVAVDGSGNVFVADSGNNAIKEILAAGGYTTVNTLGSGFEFPYGVAVDGVGNVFVADTGHNAVKEILAPVPLVASVLPGSRAVELGNPATIFATMINSGTDALANCRVSLAASAPAGLTLGYQTTNPATNALDGSPDTPVAIAGGDGVQTFLLSFQGTAAFSAPAMPLIFDCDGTPPAAIARGVDTVDLVMSSTPVADIIALAATVTDNGIVAVPNGGAAAFAVASTNIGVTAPITVSVDTGSAKLPVALNLCQTDPSSGQCLSTPSPSVTLSYAGGSAPTFSIFVQATGAIAFAPAASRIFVRFEDAGGGLHGSTSVAIETE
jgi:streptogramin lyase